MLALLAAAGGCGDGAAAPRATFRAARGDDFRVERGEVHRAAHSWVTPWFGRQASEEEAPDLLGDHRPALIATTPSHWTVALSASRAPRTLDAGVRRLADEGPPVLCEIFWRGRGAQSVRSLARAALAAEHAPWTGMRAEVPAAAGELIFVAHFEHPAQADLSGPRVAWGAVRVARRVDARDDRPDVVLLTVDTLRADALEHMPWLRGVLESAARWPDAISPSNWTLPAYASLMTGRDAGEHGAGRSPFPPEPDDGNRSFTAMMPVATVAEVFRDAGYATCLVHQNPMLEPWTGLARGFDRYLRTADRVRANEAVVEEWWARHAGRPRLLVLHYMAPHLPYAPVEVPGISDALPPDPLDAEATAALLQRDHSAAERRRFFDLPPEEREAVRERYRAEVRVLDHRLQQWLPRWLDLDDPGLVLAFHSDHGEELWDAGSFEHGHSFHDSVIRVPVALRWPGRIEPAQHAGAYPAHHLGIHLLELLALPGRERLPASELGAGAPPGARSTHPLSWAPRGGVRVDGDGNAEDLPWTGAGGGGRAPRITPAVLRQLQQLGYGGAATKPGTGSWR